MMWEVFFGFGSVQTLGSATADEAPRCENLRRLKSTSEAFCRAAERGGVTVDDGDREPMGFAIPKR